MKRSTSFAGLWCLGYALAGLGACAAASRPAPTPDPTLKEPVAAIDEPAPAPATQVACAPIDEAARAWLAELGEGREDGRQWLYLFFDELDELDEPSMRRAVDTRLCENPELGLRVHLGKGANLANLRGLEHLRVLRLYQEEAIDDDGIEHLGELTDLEVLDLRGTQIGAASLRHLAGLTRLTSLNLSGVTVNDAGLEHIAALTSLRELDLSAAGISDAGLAQLAPLQSLRTLGLTDAGLPTLAELTELRALRIYSTKVSHDGVAALQDALPDCNIGSDAD